MPRGVRNLRIGGPVVTGIDPDSRITEGLGGLLKERALGAADRVTGTAKERFSRARKKMPSKAEMKEKTDDTLAALQRYFAPTREQFEEFGFALPENEAAAIALRLLPATAAVGAVTGAGNVLLGDQQSFANKAMDTLGMGAGTLFGYYGAGGVGGTTPAGRALRMAGYGAAGKYGSDILQALVGGGAADSIIVNVDRGLG